jgi:hypothetical protein
MGGVFEQQHYGSWLFWLCVLVLAASWQPAAALFGVVVSLTVPWPWCSCLPGVLPLEHEWECRPSSHGWQWCGLRCQ